MKEILSRSYHPYLSEAGKEYRVRILPGEGIIGSPSVIVLPYPTLGDIIIEKLAEREKGVEPMIVAIAEPFRRLLIEAAFPDVIVIDSTEEASAFRRAVEAGPRKRKIRFTEMEKRILRELPFGLCGKEIAQRLGVSERSVRRMKERLMQKTGLVSTGQLMIYALLSADISTRSSSRISDTE